LIRGCPSPKVREGDCPPIGIPGNDPDIPKNRAEASRIMEKLGYGPDKRLSLAMPPATRVQDFAQLLFHHRLRCLCVMDLIQHKRTQGADRLLPQVVRHVQNRTNHMITFRDEEPFDPVDGGKPFCGDF
jgi:hypothetical protein